MGESGTGSTEPVDIYSYCYPERILMFCVSSVVRPKSLVKYYNDCNLLDNFNSIRQYYLALEIYWATQSGYFRLAKLH